MNYTCDIILLSYESPDLLKACVESVLERTHVPSRLIIVDNGSKDPGVAGYLGGVHGKGAVTVEKVMSEVNSGFAGGINKGLRLADAPFVCLLNNDCVVTEGWLQEMIDIAGRRPDIGMVCPESSTFGSRPAEGVSIEDHALILKAKKGRYTELGHAIFFACLLKKDLIDKVGHLDEIFRGVCYEDTDYSLRALKAGYITALAEGAYVYHKEQGSRRKLKDREEIYARNREIFEKRWGRLYRSFYMEYGSSGEASIAESYELLKGLARRRIYVDMWVVRPEGGKNFREKIFDSVIRHSDVTVRAVTGPLARARALWKILTKKKRYDLVIVEKGLLPVMLMFLGPLHGARLMIRDGMKLKRPDGREFDLSDPDGIARAVKDPQSAQRK